MDKLLKNYSKNYQKFRRIWINLFREKEGKSNFIKKIQPSAYLMLTLFASSLILYLCNIEYHYIPFLIGIIFIVISILYFHIYPLSWAEMTEYEKESYRLINDLPSDWEPK